MARELVEYASLLDEIKGRIRRAQTRAVASASREMLLLYWDVGRMTETSTLLAVRTPPAVS